MMGILNIITLTGSIAANITTIITATVADIHITAYPQLLPPGFTNNPDTKQQEWMQLRSHIVKDYYLQQCHHLHYILTFLAVRQTRIDHIVIINMETNRLLHYYTIIAKAPVVTTLLVMAINSTTTITRVHSSMVDTFVGCTRSAERLLDLPRVVATIMHAQQSLMDHRMRY